MWPHGMAVLFSESMVHHRLSPEANIYQLLSSGCHTHMILNIASRLLILTDLGCNLNLLADPTESNKILVNGVMQLLDDLELPPDSRLVLILAWKLKAAAQCEFTRDEFINGLTEIG